VTTFFLIRHGAHDWLGRELVGRKAGVPLNEEGREQAQAIARQLAAVSLDAIYASPLERALETAAPLAAQTRLPVQVDESFHEIDFGRWTGRTFADLEADSLWQDWNTARATACGAGGETMASAQARALAGLGRLARKHAHGRVAVFSHGDVIKAILAHDRGLSLNDLTAIAVDPGSISEITREPQEFS
jgi:probable phosphoglycerate mutase